MIVTEDMCKDIWKLSDILTKKILSSDKLPKIKFYTYEFDEVRSECLKIIIKLGEEYKDGSKSFVNYCYDYVPLRVIDRIWKDYKKMIKQIPIEEIENEASPQNLHQEIERKELVEKIYELADEIDNQILDGIMDGMTITEIADKLKVSHQAVSKRLKKMK